jgi:hypothetical protein
MKRLMGWDLILIVVLISTPHDIATTKTIQNFYNVRNYAAAGNGISLDTKAIQSAIDECAEAGGGTVYFPPGTYKASSLYLKSNVILYLQSNAILLQSKDMADYIKPEDSSYVHHTGSQYVFLHAQNVKNVSIEGKGAIDGNLALDEGNRGPLPILFENSANILIKDVTVINSPGWSITFSGCKHVDVIRVKCLNSYADGINPVCSQDVLYDGVLIEGSGDDPIAIKNDSKGYQYETKPNCGYISRDIIITNTTIRNTTRGHPAIKFGTGTYGVFRNIIVSNCTFENTGAMFTIQLMRPKYEETAERTIENITFSNIVTRNIRSLFDLTSMDVSRPIIRNILIENIIVDGFRAPSVIYGLPAAPIRDITLDNIKVTRATGPIDFWLKTRYVEGFKLSDIELQLGGHVKSALICENTNNLELDGVNMKGNVGTDPLIKLINVKGAFIHNSQAPAVKTFVYALGDQTKDISFVSNDLRKSKIPFDAAEEVQRGVVFPVAEKVEYSSLIVSKEIKANERFKVKITLKNTGETGAFKTKVYVDSKISGSKWVWLKQNECREVMLVTSRYYNPQSHQITVGPLTAIADVIPVPAAFEFGDKMKINSPAISGELTMVTVALKNIGGYKGTKAVKLYADGKVVAQKKVTLSPGEEKEISIEHRFKEDGPHNLKIADFPVWPFATFANTRANFYQSRDRIIIEAGGGLHDIRSEDREYAAIYLKDVEGDFDISVNAIKQQVTGPYCGGGLLVKNDMTKPRDSSGCVIGWRYPKYQVARFEYPMEFHIKKRGDNLSGGFDVSAEDAIIAQDIGLFVNAYSAKNQLCRVEFENFKLERPTSE